ncbi:MAG TPA: hypothetical protein PLH40_06590 [Bacteroidales bacterium]|nr:hypothetical protein [Bacteroidales bacterium]
MKALKINGSEALIINISVERLSFNGVFRAIRTTWYTFAKESAKKGIELIFKMSIDVQQVRANMKSESD